LSLTDLRPSSFIDDKSLYELKQSRDLSDTDFKSQQGFLHPDGNLDLVSDDSFGKQGERSFSVSQFKLGKTEPEDLD
jgi:hypothetical protein